MEVIDIHVHLMDKVEAGQVEQFLERTGVAAAVLISRAPDGSADKARRYAEELAEIHRRLPERVFPFLRLDPSIPRAPELLEWAVLHCGFAGLKMLPADFHPADAPARALYQTAGHLGIPLLMHTGILWLPGNNADNCRPGHMEVMWDYPQTRFAMAHIGWPWTDECTAVAQKLTRLRPELDQVFIDLTPGTPPAYRENALARCLELVGPDRLLFGSDTSLPRQTVPVGVWHRDHEIFEKLGVLLQDQEKIFAGNARRFLRRASGIK